MVEFSISNRKYTYLHDRKSNPDSIDVHHIVVKKGGLNGFGFCLSVLLLLVSSFSYLFLVEEILVVVVVWSVLLSVIVVRVMFLKLVAKESVVILPDLGVQLETHYGSGKIVRRFVPMGKILKPVLLECVTPVTCYWSLSLIVRDELEMTLVFKELRPPAKMLIPVWKALCAASDDNECS